MVGGYAVGVPEWDRKEASMKIGELSQTTGVDVETIRFYEKSGLLPAPAREANGYRAYGQAHLERLRIGNSTA